jgi:hypothetical protein
MIRCMWTTVVFLMFQRFSNPPNVSFDIPPICVGMRSITTMIDPSIQLELFLSWMGVHGLSEWISGMADLERDLGTKTLSIHKSMLYLPDLFPYHLWPLDLPFISESGKGQVTDKKTLP